MRGLHKTVSHKVIRTNSSDINPRCPHGAIILFEKNSESGSQRFYACAAYRSRSDCNFYLELDDEEFKEKCSAFSKRSKQLVTVSYRDKHQRLQEIIQAKDKFFFCHSCCCAVTKNEMSQHKGHKMNKEIDADQVMHPTKFLLPLKDTEKEAQFFFSLESKKFIVNALSSLKISKVISVGTPSLMADIPQNMNSMLLDLDWRYGVFYGESFCCYNMFNHHFLETLDDPEGSKSEKRLNTFLKSVGDDNLAILLDPPFGGRVEPIADSLKKLVQSARESGCTGDIFYFWVFPYFMEPHLAAELPGVQMLDYRVNYTDHKLFNQESRRGRKLGSPIRIFTNAPTNLIGFPKEEGYHFCKRCRTHRHNENQHCDLCQTCPSKAGGTYKHCSICKRCVKPRWNHCTTCKMCCVADHMCQKNPALKRKKKSPQGKVKSAKVYKR